MAESIHLTVQEQNNSVAMTVQEQSNPVNMTVDPAVIIRAISPTATVERTENGAVVTVTDKNGMTQAEIHDGKDITVSNRVESLDQTSLVGGQTVIDAVGIPIYVDDVSSYSEYGITDSGWYVFAKVNAPDGVTVNESTSVEGAKAIIEQGLDYINLAVRFRVAAVAQTVLIIWDTGSEETVIFRASDLAIRNLDSRITFYIYDISPFAAWSYALTTDATFSANKKYYTESEGVYTLAEVTTGDAVPANTYYNHSKLHFEGMTRNVTYRLDEMVDCPIEIALPAVPDDGYGAWFEIQMRFSASHSITLLPPEGVKIGTAQTQAQTAGINTVDLQYTDVDNVQMWTLLNTHSNIPA